MRVLVLLFVGVLLITACGIDDLPGRSGDGCSTRDGQTVYARLNAFALEWDDAVDVAASTSRIALSGPVSDLQAIRRDVQRQEWPECASTAHDHLIQHMDYTIDSFLAFMQNKSDSDVEVIMFKARAEQRNFESELKKLQPESSR